MNSAIIFNTCKEKMRKKDWIIFSIVILFLLLFFSSSASNLTISGKAVTDFEVLLLTKQTKFLTEQFNILKEYANNYFVNLDVQEEINNKLDETVEDGTFDPIINNLLVHNIYNFKTYQEAIAYEKLAIGDRFTLDDRKAQYNVDIDDGTPTDSIFKILLDNGKYAYLQYGSTVNFEVSGLVPEEDRSYNKIDIKPYLMIFINRIINQNAQMQEIIFNGGTWLFSPTCINFQSNLKRLMIRGKNQVGVFNSYSYKQMTNFAPMGNQTYILKLGGNPEFQNNPIGARGLSITNIRFTSIQDNTLNISNTLLTRGALYIDNNSGGVYPDLDFCYINGIGLGIRGSFELDFGIINFRAKAGYDYPGIIFDDNTGSNARYNNISSCNFETIRMENIAGNHVQIHKTSNFDMNTINYFELECNYPTLLGAERIGNYDGSQPIDNERYVFIGMFRRLQISHMNLSMHSNYYGRLNLQNYRIQGIFCYESDATNPALRANNYQVGQIYIRFVNAGNPAKVKQYIAVKKSDTNNELIQIGEIFVDTQIEMKEGLFQSHPSKFNRVRVGQIYDSSGDATSEMLDVVKAYRMQNTYSSGSIISFNNSQFIEGLGLSGSGQRVSEFKSSNNAPFSLLFGVYCPSGVYRISFVTDNGTVIADDHTDTTPRYIHSHVNLNAPRGTIVGVIISATTPDVIIDYFKPVTLIP